MEQGQPDKIAGQVRRIRDSGALGRSHGLLRLFEYLADPVRRGRTLREADVAQDVFGRTPELSGDASVRVYIHRLRRKLDAFYAGPGADEADRLSIPVGEYRLVVAQRSSSEAPPEGRRWPRWLAPVLVAVAALVTVNAIVWIWAARDLGPVQDVAHVAASPLWAGIGRDRPVLIVLGDYYIFGDTDHGDEPKRMIRAFEINSAADLDAWLMDNPQFQGRYIDLDTYYTPVGASLALREIMPVARQAAGSDDRLRVVTASHLTPDLMKGSDIVYVGYLSGLRLLQQPVFERSRFQIGATYDELVDRRTGETYTSGAGAAPGDRPNRDYGYLAAFQGSTGNRILVIAGTRDIGVMQAAEIAGRAGPPAPGFVRGEGEVLYEVDGVGRTNVGGKPVTPPP